MMEWTTNSSHPWLPKGEQDFHLGARATSCLPSATGTELNYDSNNLPEWMESRDTLGFSTSALFNNISSGQNEIDSLQIINQQFDADEDFSIAIKPDDMLVPLSELQPEQHTPQGLGACPFPETPKVTIRVNKIKVSTTASQNPHPKMLPPQNYGPKMGLVQPMEDQLDFDAAQNYGTKMELAQEDQLDFDAAELMNELDNLPQKNPNLLSEMFNLLDSSVVEGALNDLLSHLESDDAKQDIQRSPQENAGLVSTVYAKEPIETPQQQTELLSPAYVPSPELLSPAYVPSPVPSMGNQSPQSTEQSFYLSPNSYIVNEVNQPEESKTYVEVNQPEESKIYLSPNSYIVNEVTQPEESKIISLSSLMSPYKSESSVSSPALEDLSMPSLKDDDDISVLSTIDEDSLSVMSPITDDSSSKSDLHSYSRSPNKKKSSRKGSSRSYPEGRKERKKEQNKQAALRYRQKKKTEDDKIMLQIQAEEERQQKLKLKYGNLKQELSYLKKLMREVLISKGTISPEVFKK